MVPHMKVLAFYNALDTTRIPPFYLVRSFKTWAHVYNHAFKQYLKLRREGILNHAEGLKIMKNMMNHVSTNTENYKRI